MREFPVRTIYNYLTRFEVQPSCAGEGIIIEKVDKENLNFQK